MAKLNWDNLTKDERREYMQYQMAKPTSYGGSGYLPDDCSECPVCSTPVLGLGLCNNCIARFKELSDKVRL